MAKRENPYYKHDVDAYRDPKLITLRLQGHASAEPFFWAVLGYVYGERKPLLLDYHDADYIGFCHAMCVTCEEAEEAIRQLEDVGLLYVTLDGMVSNANADETVEAWEEISRNRSESGRKGGRPKKQNAQIEKQTESKTAETESKTKAKRANQKAEQEQEQEQEQDSAHEVRHRHGEYSNVLLSDSDLIKLQAEFPADWQQRIERLSSYMASTGKSYKSHLATIRNWARRDSRNKASPARAAGVYQASSEEGGWLPE